MNLTDETVFLRIDDRLIHGQVITTWLKSLGSKVIYVVSNRAAAEPLEIILLKSSIPAHLSLEVFPTAVAVDKLDHLIQQKTLILLERIEDALAICQAHPGIRNVNLGGLRYSPGKTGLNRAVYVSPEEALQLKQLGELGVNVWLQIVPTDPKVLATDQLHRCK